MTLASFVKKHRPRIAKELETLTALPAYYQSPWATDVAGRYRGMAGGKALRGVLTILGYGAVTGKTHTDAFRLAAVIELMHAALLVHDDVIDQDRLRRGKPSMFAQYETSAKKRADASHIGISLALCAGDVAIFHGARTLTALSAKGPSGARAADAVLAYLTDTGFGEMDDVALGVGLEAPDEKNIIRMLTGKTARYSCSMPLVAGAYLGGASQALATQLEALGEDLGLIFQIRDDELGLFGTTDEIGKPAGSDIREGKQTLFRLYLTEVASPAERTKLKKIYGNASCTEKDFQYVRDLTRSYAVDKKVARLIARREKKAAERIASLRIPAEYCGLLNEILAYVSGRAL